MPPDQSETSCSDPIVAGQPSEAGELLRPDRGGDLDGASETWQLGNSGRKSSPTTVRIRCIM